MHMSEGFAGLAIRRLFSRQNAIILLALAAFLFMVFIRLGSQPGALSPAEHTAAIHSQSFHLIAKNPLNAPHDLLSLGLSKISGAHVAMRAASAIWGVIFAIAFYSITKSMFGKTIGLVGAIILVTTPLFLISSRQASADIMLAAPALIMALYLWVSRPASDVAKALPLLIIFSCLMLYVPGMVWWLIGGAVVGRTKLENALSSAPKHRLYLSMTVGLAIIVPLALAIATDWRLIRPLALVPSHFSSPLNELKNVGWMTAAWFAKTPFHSPLIIGRLPLLNIVQDVLLVFGAYALFQAAKSKAWALVAAFAFATVAAGLNDNLSLLLIGLPAAGLLFTTGLRYLYVEWRGVFPRNPAAKYLAILLIAVIGAVQLLFGARYALVAWPHNVVTRQTYVIK